MSSTNSNPNNSNAGDEAVQFSQDYVRQRDNLVRTKQEQDARAAAFLLARTLVQSPGFRNVVQRKLNYMIQNGRSSVLVRYQQDLINFCFDRQRNSVLPDPTLRDLLLNPNQELFRVKYLASALSREATRQIQSAMEDLTEGVVYYFRYTTHCIYQLPTDRRMTSQDWRDMPLEDRYLRGLILIRAPQPTEDEVADNEEDDAEEGEDNEQDQDQDQDQDQVADTTAVATTTDATAEGVADGTDSSEE